MSRKVQFKKNSRGRHFIAAWREFRGLTGEQLAERLETSAATISRIENFKQPYSQDFLEACAEALQTDAASLIMRDPRDPEGIWTVWDHAKPGQRRQLVEIGKTLLAGGQSDDQSDVDRVDVRRSAGRKRAS